MSKPKKTEVGSAVDTQPKVEEPKAVRPDRIRRVRLLGKGLGWELCPDRQPGWELWGLNGLLFANKKLDRIFMMDILDEMPSVKSGTWELQDVIEQANKLKIRLVGPYKYDEIPTSEAYPIDEAIREFGIPYFNNTIAFMIAYALLHGVEELQIWGINQASGTEYFYEKGCVEYWLGIASGMGVKVSVHGKHSELLTNKDRYGGNKLYGYNASYEAITRSRERFGDFTIKKLLAPVDDKRVMFLGPEKSKGLRTADIMGIKKIYQGMVAPDGKVLQESQWTIDGNDAQNIARYCIETKPKRVLDLGTGIGTSAAIAKYAAPEASVTSIEQFNKVAFMAKQNVARVGLDVEILHREPETFTLEETPGIAFSGFQNLPHGPWDMVIIDGPGPFKDKNGVVLEYPNGDIFRILNDINKGAIIYVDGRKDAVKLMKRYLSRFLRLQHESLKTAVFVRNEVPYEKGKVVDELLNQLAQNNYF